MVEATVWIKFADFLEIQYNQGNKVREIVAKFFPQAEVTIFKDLAGFPRVVKILI